MSTLCPCRSLMDSRINVSVSASRCNDEIGKLIDLTRKQDFCGKMPTEVVEQRATVRAELISLARTALALAETDELELMR